MFPCALVGPLLPPPPAPCLLYVSFLCVRLFCCCFSFVPCLRSQLLPRALGVPPALLRATPVPLPCAPSLACLSSYSPSRCRPCQYFCPPCLSRAVDRVCYQRALPLPLPLAPTLFPGVSPTLVLPRSPSLTPSWLPCALCGGGVCICGLGCGPARGLAWLLVSYAPGATACAKRTQRERRGNACRSPFAAFALWSPAA